MTAINEVCPWSGEAVSGDALMTYRGQTVGFCNPGCRDKFAAASRYFDSLLPAGSGVWRWYAEYNRWFNRHLFAAVATLPARRIWRSDGLYFGSVGATLNHIMVWDLTWLGRIQDAGPPLQALATLGEYPTPTSHTDRLHDDMETLTAARTSLDNVLVALAEEVAPDAAQRVITYRTQDGTRFRKPLDGLLQHLFNHQTHHRGQVTAVLAQQGIDYGVSDLLAVLPDL